jgi:hypothetical protein
MDDLGGVYAKLHRASVHSDELARAEAEFRLRSPWTVAETLEDDWLVFRGVIMRPAPLSLSVIMGEAIHQMRSSLDHLATAAARLCDSTAREVHFPFKQRPALFDEWKKTYASHMRADHMDVIERHQPFATKAEPHELLRAMADFDNEAKHAVVPPAYAFMPVYGFMGDAEVEFLHPESIENGTALCRCRPAPGAKVVATLDIELAYGAPRGLIRQSTLMTMQYQVSEIVADARAVTPEWNVLPSRRLAPDTES